MIGPNDSPTTVDPEVPVENPQNPAAPDGLELPGNRPKPTRLPEDPT